MVCPRWWLNIVLCVKALLTVPETVLLDHFTLRVGPDLIITLGLNRLAAGPDAILQTLVVGDHSLE